MILLSPVPSSPSSLHSPPFQHLILTLVSDFLPSILTGDQLTMRCWEDGEYSEDGGKETDFCCFTILSVCVCVCVSVCVFVHTYEHK